MALEQYDFIFASCLQDVGKGREQERKLCLQDVGKGREQERKLCLQDVAKGREQERKLWREPTFLDGN